MGAGRSALAEGARQQQRRTALPLAVILERPPAPRGIGGDRAEQRPQLLGTRRIEGAIGALADAGDLAEGAARDGVAAFMEDEDRNPEEAELPCPSAEPVDALLHRVADEDERGDPPRPRRARRMVEHAGDLRLAADAGDAAHCAVQRRRRGEPAACLALRKAAIEDELHLEPAERRRRLEHLSLDAAGTIPARLAARRR